MLSRNKALERGIERLIYDNSQTTLLYSVSYSASCSIC